MQRQLTASIPFDMVEIVVNKAQRTKTHIYRFFDSSPSSFDWINVIQPNTFVKYVCVYW